jgi:hypothetical protein
VLLIRPDDELSLAWPFPRSAQGGWLCLTCGRVACSDDFPNQHAGACPHRRWCSVRQRTAQPTCWLQSAPTPESLQSAASTTRCPHYRRLAITDEASPFALRSTRIRLRRAMRRGAAWPAEQPSSRLVVREHTHGWASQRAVARVVAREVRIPAVRSSPCPRCVWQLVSRCPMRASGGPRGLSK